MAYTWEPRWEPVTLESHGIVIKTCRDRVTKMIACPICIHAASTCLGQDKGLSESKSSTMFFFTVEDLIIHIRDYHAKKFLKKILREGE